MAHEGNSVLILEDQLLLSMDLEMKLEALGLTVFGSFKCVESALQALDQGTPQAALLDINLGHDRTSEPVAQRLRALGVPFAFITGYHQDIEFLEKFREAPYSGKPIDLPRLRSILLALLPSLDNLHHPIAG